ncbi:hypothetical protein TPHA_0J00580 [Tetrapisispora phaffii CBS 4417]|uniref:Transcriptional protein SWT1 n=1 Tax=Tetrapisispora phaffii (strain ATCC 24235 / CBS 4417 / NBRC 1672 / NRRL Y-8282 / UCD 70-5) TaxID=1071381 RepID=G8BYD9_TETPH|nr:hypothetical protein TPHA_0J00580 [Tetrapisispora phaffii CBS 4417]CCE64881.1 hypothetical protein TPHA_0J00580 [Tetrapisispora phaffii CBS 4417]
MDIDGDNYMLDVQNEGQVRDITNYISSQRVNENSLMSVEEIDSAIPVMELTSTQTIFVVDTNFVISHLNTLERLRQLSEKLYHKIVIPNTVFKELDGLKQSDRMAKWSPTDGQALESTIGALARRANDWIYRNLTNQGTGIMGQKLRQRLDLLCIKDDAILDCCLYFKEKLKSFVILLSNDKNLCLKALAEDILTVSYVPTMTAELIATKAYDENIFRFGIRGNYQTEMSIDTNNETHDINLNTNEKPNYTTVDRIEIDTTNDTPEVKDLDISETAPYLYNEITIHVIEGINDAMKEEYGDELELIDYNKEKIKNLTDCSKCLRKFWLSVFSSYFRGAKLYQNSWKDLPNVLTVIPETINDLIVFNNFWQDIIRHLLSKKDKTEQLHSKQIFKDWNSIIKHSK